MAKSTKKATFKNAFPKKKKATAKKAPAKKAPAKKATKTSAKESAAKANAETIGSPLAKRAAAKRAEKAAKTPAAANDDAKTQKANTPAEDAKATKDAKSEKPAKVKKTGCLDAAAKVLGETGEPLTVKAITDAALAKGYWSTGGKTLHQTLAAALLREIANKGDQSRFAKPERRQRFDADRLRADRPQRVPDGTRSALLRRHRPALGEVYRPQGRPRGDTARNAGGDEGRT